MCQARAGKEPSEGFPELSLGMERKKEGASPVRDKNRIESQILIESQLCLLGDPHPPPNVIGEGERFARYTCR